jgi:hypothetical protein
MNSQSIGALAMAEAMMDSPDGAIATSAYKVLIKRLVDALVAETGAEKAVVNRLSIPTIGTVLTLTDDWTFPLQPEYRNQAAYELLTGKAFIGRAYDDLVKDTKMVTLPKGSKLKVDRIYIRKGASDYDSITFWLTDCPNKKWAPKKAGGTATLRGRFWVRLTDANGVMFEQEPVANAD